MPKSLKKVHSMNEQEQTQDISAGIMETRRAAKRKQSEIDFQSKIVKRRKMESHASSSPTEKPEGNSSCDENDEEIPNKQDDSSKKSKKHKCTKCHKSFERKYHLNLHVNRVHSIHVSKYMCPECEAPVGEIPILRIHFQRKHPDIDCNISSKNGDFFYNGEEIQKVLIASSDLKNGRYYEPEPSGKTGIHSKLTKSKRSNKIKIKLPLTSAKKANIKPKKKAKDGEGSEKKEESNLKRFQPSYTGTMRCLPDFLCNGRSTLLDVYFFVYCLLFIHQIMDKNPCPSDVAFDLVWTLWTAIH